MPHVTLKDILKDAEERKYGIPCLAGANLEMIIGAIRAAEEKKAPLILCYNKQLTPDIPIEITMPILVNCAKRAKIPIATILDHGSDFSLIMRSIYLGSSSVMFDGSGLAFEDNIAGTIEVVKVAHSLGVSVEAELGGVGGDVTEATATSSRESKKTVPSDAVEFVERTKVDALAIAFGNVHGKYHGTPEIDLGLVRDIASKVDVPLVMHGASGLDFDAYEGIIKSGICKINYFSAMCKGIYSKMRDFLDSTGENAFCINTIPMSIDFWYEETKELLDVLMCSGKADTRIGDLKGVDGDNQRLTDYISEIVYKNIKKIK